MALITENFAPRMTAFEGAFERVARFFAALRAGQAAAADFERLSGMSDESLAAKGFSRSTVTRAVLDRHFG